MRDFDGRLEKLLRGLVRPPNLDARVHPPAALGGTCLASAVGTAADRRASAGLVHVGVLQ
jgi:hypothetical protein